MICKCIEDLKIIQNQYPESSRGYESLRLAIIILERAIEVQEKVNPHWVAGEEASSAGQR